MTNRGFIIMIRYQNNSQVCGNTWIHHHQKNSIHLSRRVKSCFCCSLMRTGWSYSTGFPVGRQWTATIMQMSWKHLRGAMRKKRPDLLKKQWFLLQDNARPHIASVALAALTEIGGTALKHPPYSPDLAPCDLWAFPMPKRQLRGNRRWSEKRHGRSAKRDVTTTYFMCLNRL